MWFKIHVQLSWYVWCTVRSGCHCIYREHAREHVLHVRVLVTRASRNCCRRARAYTLPAFAGKPSDRNHAATFIDRLRFL